MFEPLTAPLEDYATADQELIAELDGVSYHKLELVIKRCHGSYAGVYCNWRDWDKTAAGRITQLAYLADQQQQQLTLLAERAERAQAEVERLARQLGASASDRDLGQLALLDTVKRFGESNKALQLERDGLRIALDEARRELSGLMPAAEIPFTPEVNAIEPLDLDEALDLTPNPADDQSEPESFACRYGCGKVSESELGRKIHEGRRHGGPFVESAPTPLAVAPDDVPFVCSQCNSSAFTRSMTHPDRCMRCASKARQSPHTFAEAA